MSHRTHSLKAWKITDNAENDYCIGLDQVNTSPVFFGASQCFKLCLLMGSYFVMMYDWISHSCKPTLETGKNDVRIKL